MSLGPTEVILIVLVVVLLFGAKKLPELARGSGRALRIFKSETKGLVKDDDDVSDGQKTPEEKELEARREQSEPVIRERSDPVVPEQRDGTSG